MTETPFFFPNGSYNLFGVFHEPPGRSSKSAFVFCHPWGEEKLWAHRVFVSFARALAADGHPVLRFDFMGNGDSEGTFSDLSITTFKTDLHRAIEEVKRLTGAPSVSLLGLRFGATIASLVAEETAGIHHLILWAPITDGEQYLQELLRINLMTQMTTYKVVRQERPELVAAMQQGQTVNVDGYEMGWPLYSSVAPIRAAQTPHVFGGPCLIVQIDRQPRPAADLQRLGTTYPAATVKFAQEEAFWKEIARFYQSAPNLFEITTSWLAAAQ